MKKLSLSHTPIQFSDEFIGSFLLRASYANGYESPKKMLNSAGIPVYTSSYESIFTDETKFKKVIEQLGLSNGLVDLVLRKSPPTFQNFFWTNTQVIQTRLVNISLNKFCSSCLKDNGYWKKNWLLNPLTVCLEHNIDLTTNCPKCLDQLPIDRRSLYECPNCNFDLRTHTSTPATINDVKTNNWFLENLTLNDEHFLTIFFDIWIALFEYFSNLGIQMNKSYILNLCYIFFHNEDFFISSLIKEIEKNLDYAHPQIQLLPFSKKKSRFKSIIFKVQSQFIEYKKFSPKPINKKFNKDETIYILGVSFSSFNKRLKVGILYHDQLKNNNKNTFTTKILEDWLINEKKNINGTYTYHHPPHLVDESEYYYDVNEISKILGININTTRQFLNIPNIPTTKKYLNYHTKSCLDKKFLTDFNRQYIFLSVLASHLDVPSTTLKDKLASIKINPIYNEKLYPAYYLRDDVSHLNKSMLSNIKSFKNNRGRKKKGDKSSTTNILFSGINEASNILKISPLQVAQLIQHKWLKVKDPNARPHQIYKKSIDNLLQQIHDPTFVDLDEVLETLNCSFNQLQKNWIMTGYLDLRHIGYWRSFHRKQFNHVVEIHKEFFTAAEANAFLGMHRTHITNLITQGLIKPYLYGNHNYSIRLFKKEDVKKLLKEGYGVQKPSEKS